MKIAVFYHCKLSGDGIPSTDAAVDIVAEQMEALRSTGLADAAEEIHLGINGPESDGLLLAALATGKTFLHVHGKDSHFEFPTFHLLGGWVRTHPDWFVLYHHSKGVTQPGDAFHHHHRRVMQRFCVEGWRQCVADLVRGYEAVGCNYVDPVKRPVLPGRFFAGNFWWARADYLCRLEILPPSGWNRIDCEGWVATGRPKVLDYERPELYPP